jgi:hypothetical protein
MPQRNCSLRRGAPNSALQRYFCSYFPEGGRAASPAAPPTTMQAAARAVYRGLAPDVRGSESLLQLALVPDVNRPGFYLRPCVSTPLQASISNVATPLLAFHIQNGTATRCVLSSICNALEVTRASVLFYFWNVFSYCVPEPSTQSEKANGRQPRRTCAASTDKTVIPVKSTKFRISTRAADG